MSVKELEQEVCELVECLIWCEENWIKSKKHRKSRKEMVLDILERSKLVAIAEIGTELGMTNRNVSTILSYLRDDGYTIGKIGRGHGKLKLVGRIDDDGKEYEHRDGKYLLAE